MVGLRPTAVAVAEEEEVLIAFPLATSRPLLEDFVVVVVVAVVEVVVVLVLVVVVSPFLYSGWEGSRDLSFMSGCSWKYLCWMALVTVILRSGSYVNIRSSKSMVLVVALGNLARSWLLGWCGRWKVAYSGSWSSPGHRATVGEPISCTINEISSSSVLPGSSGACIKNSPKIQPTDHMSTATE